MIAWFARNDVAANLLMAAVVMLGLYALSTELGVEVFPTTEAEVISVSVSLRGATPEDVELGVAVRIEEALHDLAGVKRLVSRSSEGGTSVTVEVDEDYDPRELLDEVKSRVDAINTFPVDAERPVIRLAQWTREVISVVVAGPFQEAEIRGYAEFLRDELLRLPEVSLVELDAVRAYEIAIEASQDRLRDYRLTLADLAQAVRANSVDLSAGNVRTRGGDVLIRSQGQAYRQQDFADIVVKTNPDGSIVRVGDVATVKDAFVEDAVRTRFDGQPAATLEIERTGNQSALEIADAVKAFITAKQPALPTGMTLTWWDDNSQQLKDRLGVLASSALQGGVLVLVLLTLFLRPTIAFWVFIGIPISFLGAFAVMALFGLTINLMSAFGFIVVLGIVVDDAIVTGESVYRRLKRGESGLDAAIGGTQDVAVPVTFGVLTTMVAFAPLMLIEGMFGSIMAPVVGVVLAVLLFSLIESKFVLPAHLKHIRNHSEHGRFDGLWRWQRRFADGFEAVILRYYRPLLKRAIDRRYLTLSIFVGVFVLMLALIASGWTRFTFMPRVQFETATASLEMPVGTPFEVTDGYVTRMLESALILQDKYRDPATGESVIRHVLASTGSRRGGNAPHYGRVQFEMTPPERRAVDVDTQRMIGEWRRLIGEVPGAEALTFRADFFRAGNPIDVQLSGNSMAALSGAAEELKAFLARYPTVYEVADSLSDGKEELQVELKPQGTVLGLTRSDVLSQLGEAFKGFEAQRIQRGRDDIRVLVRLPERERASLQTLRELLITTPGGAAVPLAQVAELIPGVGPSVITRIDGYRTMNVTAEVDKTDTNMTVLQREIAAFTEQLVQKYPGLDFQLEGEAREQRDSFESLQWSLVLVLFVIYAMLALPLKSYTKPLIVMSVIPFSLIGAVLGHWLMGYTLSMLSVLGLMALMGVVVNDSLVLVDYIRRQAALGRELYDAVLDAGVVRFRPVMLTSLTTFFGLAPLLTEQSTTAQFLIPMGISLGFGILFATLITLFLVPVNCLIARDGARWLRRAGRAAVAGA